MQSFSSIARADLELIFSELNSFRWPAILPLKPDDWHDPDPFYPWPDNDGRSGLEKWRHWKETIAGKTQTAIINELRPLLGIPHVALLPTRLGD